MLCANAFRVYLFVWNSPVQVVLCSKASGSDRAAPSALIFIIADKTYFSERNALTQQTRGRCFCCWTGQTTPIVGALRFKGTSVLPAQLELVKHNLLALDVPNSPRVAVHTRYYQRQWLPTAINVSVMPVALITVYVFHSWQFPDPHVCVAHRDSIFCNDQY